MRIRETIMDSINIAAALFWLSALGTYVAYLWFGCDLRNLYREEREAAQRRRDDEKQFETRNFHSDAVLDRITRLRDQRELPVCKPLTSPRDYQSHAEIRKLVAEKSFFTRRRKAKESEPQS